MTQAAPPASADRLASVIDLLCRVVAAQIAGRRLAGPLIILIWRRLRRIGNRCAVVAARLQAGKLRRRAVLRPRPALPAARPTRPCRPRPLPHGFAWLVRMVPDTAGGASQLCHLLTQPDMQALIAAAPQVGRPLRSLCWMLGVRPPPGLKPARNGPPAAPAAPAARITAGRPTPAAAPPATPPPSAAAPVAPLRLAPRTCGPPDRD